MAIDAARGGAEALAGQPLGIELGDHYVCGMRDDGTRDARNVAAQERDARLHGLAVLGFRLGHACVDHGHNGLEGAEFHLRSAG